MKTGHSMQIGEALAELVNQGLLFEMLALDIISGALLQRPSDQERGRCFACLAAFYMRLSFFQERGSIQMDTTAMQTCRQLLPRLFSEVCSGCWLAALHGSGLFRRPARYLISRVSICKG